MLLPLVKASGSGGIKLRVGVLVPVGAPAVWLGSSLVIGATGGLGGKGWGAWGVPGGDCVSVGVGAGLAECCGVDCAVVLEGEGGECVSVGGGG